MSTVNTVVFELRSYTKYFSVSLELIPSPWRRKVCAFETFMAAWRVYRCPNPEDHVLNHNIFFSLEVKHGEILVCKRGLKEVLFLGYVFYIDLFICYFDSI